MPWEKSFDIDDAVDRAMSVFWAKGYEATSLADLLGAMGINKGSFYNAFGSKHALFTKGLLKYDRENRSAALRDLEARNDPVHAIPAFFDLLIRECADDPERKGCFLINTALDLPNHDPEVADIVQHGMDDLETFFLGQINLGQETGAIPKTRDPQSAARALLALVVGLRVLGRGVYDADALSAIRDQAVEIIS